MKTEKLSRSFIISYIVSFGLLLISIVMFVIATRLEPRLITIYILSALGYLYLFTIFFISSLSTMILSIILGIKNKKRITNKILKSRITKMIWFILISHVLVIIYLIVDIYIPSNQLESKKIPEYDFNEAWSCNKYGSNNNTRTYTFKENGSIEAKLDSDPENYYLIGSYSIEDESIEGSLYIGDEKAGKVKKYTLKIDFEKFVSDGQILFEEPVTWYISVYNGNYMTLTVANGALYECTMK